MAKLSRKQRQKKKAKQLNVLKNQGYSQKQLQTLSNAEIERQSQKIISQRRAEIQRKEKARRKVEKANDLLNWKRNVLKSLGFEDEFLKTTYLRKVKVSDIKSYRAAVNGFEKDETGKLANINALSGEKYPFLYDTYRFNFNKIYKFPAGKGLALRFLDYTGESSVDDLMRTFHNMSNETLMAILEGIVRQPKTYNKKAPNRGAGTSSGRAGTFLSSVTDEKTAQTMLNIDNDKIARSRANEKKKRFHTGINSYWQTFGENGKPIITSMSGHECLVILNAVMYNVTEDSRDMYNGLYKNITKYIPEFKKILPKP